MKWFEGVVSPTSTESVCLNGEEEENWGIEYKSDSDIYSQWKIIFQFSSKTQTTLKTLVRHNILHESYNSSVTMCNISLHIFLCFNKRSDKRSTIAATHYFS